MKRAQAIAPDDPSTPDGSGASEPVSGASAPIDAGWHRVAGSAAFAAMGAWSAWGGYSMGLFGFGMPEPGFFPFVFGSLLMVIALVSLVVDIVGTLRTGAPAAPRDESALAGPARAMGYLAIGIGCGVGMNWIGYLPAVLIGLFVLMRFVEGIAWRASLLSSLGAAVVSDLLFVRLLSVPLPATPF